MQTQQGEIKFYRHENEKIIHAFVERGGDKKEQKD